MIDPQLLLQAYCSGLFPMAETAHDKHCFWVEPKKRGILPLDQFHVSHSLRRFIRQNIFDVRFDTAFKDVMQLCADRNETWINQEILESYCLLHNLGFAHSVECWDEDGLQGGLYGVSINGAFFGESMFHKKTNASKVALVALVEHLNNKKFSLLDTQFITNHLKTFGAIEITQPQYLKLLNKALALKVSF